MKRTLRFAVSSLLIIAALILPNAVSCYAAASFNSVVGGREMIYATWSSDTGADGASVFYKEVGDSTYTQVDGPLVRSVNGGGRVDIPGLRAGDYDLRVVTGDGTVLSRTSIPVEADDRSGYAHFNYNGVGAYNDDGTPKDNAVIIYVTNENKNTVTFGQYKGLGDILTHAGNINVPLIVRIIGTVDTQTRDSDGTKATDIANGVVALEGLTDRVSSGGDDSYFNMMDVKNAANITIEGIGDDAVIEKWGFTFSDSESIDVKNLRFTKYPEDACSTARSNNVWIHSNTFDIGENKYDLTPEQDKGEGDGSTDINQSEYVTLSYNRYNKTHKTSLHGGGDSQKQYNITWHHNYFNDVSSRMPLVRHANVHMYNNYFYSGTNCVDARASAWVFTENNYFEDCAYAFKTTENTTEGNPVIKSYNDVLISSKISDKTGTVYIADTRDQTYNVDEYKEDYANFDVDPSLFYYDESTKTSRVAKLTSPEQAKEDCIRLSGVLVSEKRMDGQEPVLYLHGDADNSGVLTSNDSAMILKKIVQPDFVTELDKVTVNSLQYMDMDGDGHLSANDAAMVLSMVLDPTIDPAL